MSNISNNKVIAFLFGWIASLLIYLLVWGWGLLQVPFLYYAMILVQILATFYFWRVRRFVAYGLLLTLVLVFIPLLFWDWWREFSYTLWRWWITLRG